MSGDRKANSVLRLCDSILYLGRLRVKESSLSFRVCGRELEDIAWVPLGVPYKALKIRI